MKSRQKIEISCNDPSFISEFYLFMYKISFHGNRIKATILWISDHQSNTRTLCKISRTICTLNQCTLSVKYLF